MKDQDIFTVELTADCSTHRTNNMYTLVDPPVCRRLPHVSAAGPALTRC